MKNKNQDLTFKGLCNVYRALGLQGAINKRERANGTTVFIDPVVDAKYTFSPSGYFRRTYVNDELQYVSTTLNPTVKSGRKTKRVLVKNRTRQMELAIKNIASFRNQGGFAGS